MACVKRKSCSIRDKFIISYFVHCNAHKCVNTLLRLCKNIFSTIYFYLHILNLQNYEIKTIKYYNIKCKTYINLVFQFLQFFSKFRCKLFEGRGSELLLKTKKNKRNQKNAGPLLAHRFDYLAYEISFIYYKDVTAKQIFES